MIELTEDRKKPIVSICILTFNHEDFIEKVLEGILTQKVNFEFETFIYDDGSIDKTIEIIEKYKLKYPNKIKAFYNNNKGQRYATLNFFKLAKGKYLIVNDGDDFWINEKKLQTQIDFLESNSEYIASCHDVKIEHKEFVNNNPIAKLQTKGNYKYISQFTTYRGNTIENWEILLGTTYIQNCSLVWKKFDISPYLEGFSNVKFNLDWLFSVILSMQGKIQYINEPWAIYNDHYSGRTKNTYFYNYLLDKIITLNYLKKLNYYKSISGYRSINCLIARTYSEILENPSGGQRNFYSFTKYILLYFYFMQICSITNIIYFWKNRANIIKS